MSRIVIKNLPKHITHERVRKVFEQKGQITDLQLKYTKDGKFRQFAFVGYKSEDEAAAAKEYFHNTYLDTSKIQVEICAALGDTSKPRAWSKYSAESSAHQKKVQKASESEKTDQKNDDEKDTSSKNAVATKSTSEKTNELENDPKFLEFMEVTKKRSERPVWSNDAIDTSLLNDAIHQDIQEKKSKSKKKNSEAKDTSNDAEITPDASKDDKKKTKKKTKKTDKKEISDLEFLRSKVVKSLDEEEERNSADEKQDGNSDSHNKDHKEGDNFKENKEATTGDKVKQSPKFDNKFTVKLRGLPYKTPKETKKLVKAFFYPLKPVSLRVPPKIKGIGYAKFKTEKEFKQALNKHRGFISGHRISVVNYEETSQRTESMTEAALQEKGSSNEEPGDDVADSGRIFARNLPYTVTEDDLEKLFKKYGPIDEIHLPIDPLTRKIKGFAFITFLLAEHAIKALTELDGTSFQGRTLHLIPAKSKELNAVEIPDDIAYKKKKKAQLKALSGSSHNWNALFLGANAVADLMAEKYNISKSQLLSAETSDSVAVRLALGETQLVSETRDFLLKHNVQLDVFGQPAAERSKTVMLVKNLPAKTSSDEIRELFAKHGKVLQVILPPSGVTAIVEFEVPSEAKIAFKKLAYSKFHHLPLYLEWAPVNVFKPAEPESNENVEQEGKQEKKEEEASSSEDEAEPETTLFVKNLNFETTEESLQKHFEKYGRLHSVTIAKKKDIRNPGKFLSMGYGFVQFKKNQMAMEALKNLQHSMLDGHALELKMSNREAQVKPVTARKKAKATKQKTTKILVRNIPFQAELNEIKQLFSVFGELRAVRLPKKMDGTHRGFAFVDFLSKNDAKRAFKSLCNSTHFYGRRLVLEWAETETDDIETLQKRTREQYHDEGPKQKRMKSKDLIASLEETEAS